MSVVTSTAAELRQLRADIASSNLLHNQVLQFCGNNPGLGPEERASASVSIRNTHDAIQGAFPTVMVKSCCPQVDLDGYATGQPHAYYFIPVGAAVDTQLHQLGFQNGQWEDYRLTRDGMVHVAVSVPVTADEDAGATDEREFYRSAYNSVDKWLAGVHGTHVLLVAAVLRRLGGPIGDLAALRIAYAIVTAVSIGANPCKVEPDVVLKAFLVTACETMGNDSQYRFVCASEATKDRPTVDGPNTLFELSPRQRHSLYLRLKHVETRILERMTNYIDNNLHSQYLGQELFSTLLNRNKYIRLDQYEYQLVVVVSVAPDWDGASRLFRLRIEMERHLDTFLDHMGIQVQNYDLELTGGADSITVSLRYNVAQDPAYISPLVLGPELGAGPAALAEFELLFGSAAEARHFATGENRLCVDNRGLHSVPEAMRARFPGFCQRVLRGSRTALAAGRADTAVSVERILPGCYARRELTAAGLLHLNGVLRGIQDQVASNPGLHFSIGEFQIVDLNQAMLTPQISRARGGQRCVHVYATLDFVVGKRLQFRQYEAVQVLKQLFVSQIARSARLGPMDELGYVGANQLNLTTPFVHCGTTYYLSVNVIFKFTFEDQLLGIYSEAKQRRQQLIGPKARHNEMLNNLGVGMTVVLQLVKRFLAAHLVKLFGITFNEDIDGHRNIFNTQMFENFRREYPELRVDSFMDEELQQLFETSQQQVVQELVGVPSSDLYAGDMVNEELVELICWYYLQHHCFYSEHNVAMCFHSCLLFIRQIVERMADGVTLSALDSRELYVGGATAGSVKVYAPHDRTAALSLEIAATSLGQNGLCGVIGLAAFRPLGTGIFRTSVRRVSHVLVLRPGVAFREYDPRYQLAAANRTVKCMVRCAAQVAMLRHTGHSLAQARDCTPLNLILPIIARYGAVELMYDVYGGRAIYLAFPGHHRESFDIARACCCRFAERLDMDIDERYVVGQIALQSGIFCDVLVERDRAQWEGCDTELAGPEEGEEAEEATEGSAAGAVGAKITKE